MLTLEGGLYSELNKCLKNKSGQKISFYYISLLAALKYYEPISYHQMKIDGIFKNFDQKTKYIEVYQGSYISQNELEIYKGLCSDQLPKIQLLTEFLSTSFCRQNIEAFFLFKDKKIQVLHIFKIPLNSSNSPFIYLGGELNIYPTSKECLIKSGSLTEITKIEKINENRIHIYHLVYEKGVDAINEYEAMGREISMEPEIKNKILKLLNEKSNISRDLEKLKLGTIDQHVMKTVMKALIQNKSSPTVYLNENNLGIGNPENVNLLFEMLIQHENINYLGLSRNHFGKGKIENMRALSKFLTHTEKITKIGLEHNKFGKGDVENMRLLAKSLGKNHSVRLVEFDKNGIGKGNLENIKLFSEIFIKNGKIKELNLRKNHLGDEGSDKNLKILVEALIQNKTITTLDLSSNNFCYGNEENIKLLCQLLLENKTITHLLMHNDCLGIAKIETMKPVSEALIQNKTITHIEFGNCRFGHENNKAFG